MTESEGQITRNMIARIRRIAGQVRIALEKLDKAAWPSRLQPHDFPKGYCGEASLLLAKYLQEQGCGTFGYMTGIYGRDWNHGWLQRDDLVIDITADQFPDGLEPVIVRRKSSWHNGLGCVEAQYRVADFMDQDDQLSDELRAVYPKLCEQLKR